MGRKTDWHFRLKQAFPFWDQVIETDQFILLALRPFDFPTLRRAHFFCSSVHSRYLLIIIIHAKSSKTLTE